jgi:hypothetical protein
MYRYMGSPNQLAVDMPDHTVKIFYGITQDLGAALTAGGKPQRPYNFSQYNVVSPQWGLAPAGYYVVTQFMGGFLLDGCPLNVIFGQGFQSGQQEALSASGIYCNAAAPTASSASGVTASAVSASAGPIPGSTIVGFTSGPDYANTNPTQVIITPGAGTVAPVASAPGGPILPTGPVTTIDTGGGGGGAPGLPAPASDMTMILVFGALALILLSRGKG